MQLLPLEIISQARKEKMKILDAQLREFVQCSKVGERVECPKCHYASKKNKFSAVIFENAIKCFACGMWRRLE